MALKGEAARGTKLPKPTYSIIRSLGGGNVGQAYVVEHAGFGKCVQKTYSTLGMEDAVAFQEPRILKEIQHPHVPRVFEAQHDPDLDRAITFVTEFCEGESVAKAFDEDYRFSIGQAIRLALQALDALAHAHVRDDLAVVHRDVKPGNIFLDAERRTAYVGDWGSAARMEPDGLVGGIEGSPLYIPPEGGPQDGRVGVPGDIYGLSMTLFELLNGPFDYASIPPAVVDRRITSRRRALRDVDYNVFAPHVPEGLRRVVRKAIRRNPAQRFQSATEMIRRLERVRCVDWTHVDGESLDGTWEGGWPPHLPDARRRRYSVKSYILGGGPARGRRRLEARQTVALSSTPRRFGVEDETIDADDATAVDRFFSAIEASVAQRIPAR